MNMPGPDGGHALKDVANWGKHAEARCGGTGPTALLWAMELYANILSGSLDHEDGSEFAR